eukprot:gene32687-39520_t
MCRGSDLEIQRVSNGDIPSEISSLDTASPPSLSGMILPDTSIVSLYGADNLGIILWTFVLYNGLYVTPLRPVDAFIPLVAQLVQQEGSQWYKDFQDGFSCQKPPLVDFITISFFILAGYLLNSFVNSSLGGDHSWGWSIGACLAIPSGLFSVAKSKKLTREDAIKQHELEEEFDKFANSRLRRVKGREIAESRLIESFRRHYTPARLEKDVSYAVLRKVVRRWVGYKPEKENKIYKGLEFSALLPPERTPVGRVDAKYEVQDQEPVLTASNDAVVPSSGSDFIRN